MTWALLASAIFLGAGWISYLLYNAPLMTDQDSEHRRAMALSKAKDD